MLTWREANWANQVAEITSRDRNNLNDATKKCYFKLLPAQKGANSTNQNADTGHVTRR